MAKDEYADILADAGIVLKKFTVQELEAELKSRKESELAQRKEMEAKWQAELDAHISQMRSSLAMIKHIETEAKSTVNRYNADDFEKLKAELAEADFTVTQWQYSQKCY